MLILEENFRWHLEAFASELFIYIYIYIYIYIIIHSLYVYYVNNVIYNVYYIQHCFCYF